MVKVGSYQAKTHLPRLLKRVARGERITITRHGVPVAMLVPVEGTPTLDRKAAVAAMKAFSKGRRLEGISIRELIEEGRKY
ncbi:MAG: type II toxin-antitoxin system prevent-host-death family antitoxin [Acidobacteria bacterium]|nr:type II toxin-antitoxin system prevent-host-death family antitoxin [Acidobacteriota bacterium]MBI1983905.1 type II toxin-antitoxin system prevent-host-death family antitoxin [Acidobacteriota bacterium]